MRRRKRKRKGCNWVDSRYAPAGLDECKPRRKTAADGATPAPTSKPRLSLVRDTPHWPLNLPAGVRWASGKSSTHLRTTEKTARMRREAGTEEGRQTSKGRRKAGKQATRNKQAGDIGMGMGSVRGKQTSASTKRKPSEQSRASRASQCDKSARAPRRAATHQTVQPLNGIVMAQSQRLVSSQAAARIFSAT